MRRCNEVLGKIIQLTETMTELADQGDEAREDVGCGVLYGLLRDSAFKIRKLAEQEKENHIRKGWWPEEKKSAGIGAVLRKPVRSRAMPLKPLAEADESE